MSEAVIEFEEVSKHFPLRRFRPLSLKDTLLHLPARLRESRSTERLVALEGVSFRVEAGECLGIIGANGAGKSTLLGLMAGILRPSSGRVSVRGRVVPLLELGAGFHPLLTGRDNVLLNAVLLGLGRREAAARLASIVAFAELDDFIDQPLRTYSSGMQARLGFSVAAHLDPEILLVDEVLAVGDRAFTARCLDRIETFRQAGVTIIYVSHDLETVERVCSRVLRLGHGRLQSIGAVTSGIAGYRDDRASSPL